MKRRYKAGAVLVWTGIFILLAVAAFYNGLTVKKYTVNTDKLSSGKIIKVVAVSDLHGCVYGENQEDIVSLVEKQNPDIILLAGDMVDRESPIEGVELFLAGIKEIAPVYYVTGNHEIWTGEVEYIKKTFRKYGVKVLEHSYESLKLKNSHIIIGGVDDPDIENYWDNGADWIKQMHEAFAGLRGKPGFKILLTHRPEFIEVYKRFDFDLVVSGHTYGGQVRIQFFINGLYAPNQGWFPEYAGGMYRHGELTHIVCRCVSIDARMPRIFNPPEIAVIDIRGTG
ncbi:MAG: metallophosphoesterase [Bacillota bacterium]